MRKNQNGFTLVEGMLILIFITLLGFTGWYVYNQNKSSQKHSGSSNQENNTVSQDSKSNTFSHEDLMFTFEYPNDWETIDNTTDYGFYSVRLRAPGTVIESDMGEKLTAGAQIMLLRNPVSMQAGTLIDNIQKFENSSVQAKNLINKKTINIDGVEMLEYDNDSQSEGGTNLHGVQFYKDGIDYSITLDNKQYSQDKYGNVFDSMIKSIKFNKQ